LGEFENARLHLEQSFALYNPQLPQAKVLLAGQDPRASALAHLAVLLWIMGYPEQAHVRSQQALAITEEAGFPYSRALTANLVATLSLCCRDFPAVAAHAESARIFARECGFVHLATMGMSLQGWALVMLGKHAEGLALIQSGLKQQRATGIGIGEVAYQLLLADAHRETGQIESALHALDDAWGTVERTEERTFAPELYRLQGELILRQCGMRNAESKIPSHQPLTPSPQVERVREAEECFRKAIDTARQQQAKSLELRATMSLARLWQQQRAHDAARTPQNEAFLMLSKVYSWFVEGFDTPDLREAKTLLAELRSVD